MSSTRLDKHIDRLRTRHADWPIPWIDVEALGRSEDCRQTAYRCIAGRWSIAWGETEGVTPEMHWTLDQCDARFLQQVTRYARKVEAMCTLPPNANQLGAFVRLAYNIGLAALAKSTAMRRHNAGDFAAAARAISLWDKYTDPQTGQLRVSAGLSARRALERARYLTPLDDAPREPMPQAVEAESGLAKSPILQGAATVGAGGLGLAGTALEQGKVIADKVQEFVGLPWQALLAGVIVIAVVVIANQRSKQRDQGWA